MIITAIGKLKQLLSFKPVIFYNVWLRNKVWIVGNGWEIRFKIKKGENADQLGSWNVVQQEIRLHWSGFQKQ